MLRGVLDDAALLRQAEAVEQKAADGQQHGRDPDAVNPAAQRLADVVLEDRPVRQPAVDRDRLLFLDGRFHVPILKFHRGERGRRGEKTK